MTLWAVGLMAFAAFVVGGINVIGGDVKLKPGTYILNNGGLVIANGGKISGENVGFYLTGALGLSTVQLAPSSTVSLTAPRASDMAGMLFFEDRSVLFKFPHLISRKFDMKDGPELVLNTDYESSPIPVPDGVGNKSRPMVRLAAAAER